MNISPVLIHHGASCSYIPAFLGHEGVAAGAVLPCIITAGSVAVAPENSHGVKVSNNVRLAAAQPGAVITIHG